MTKMDRKRVPASSVWTKRRTVKIWPKDATIHSAEVTVTWQMETGNRSNVAVFAVWGLTVRNLKDPLAERAVDLRNWKRKVHDPTISGRSAQRGDWPHYL